MNDFGVGGNGIGDGIDGVLGLGFLFVVLFINILGFIIKRGYEIWYVDVD